MHILLATVLNAAFEICVSSGVVDVHRSLIPASIGIIAYFVAISVAVSKISALAGYFWNISNCVWGGSNANSGKSSLPRTGS